MAQGRLSDPRAVQFASLPGRYNPYCFAHTGKESVYGDAQIAVGPDFVGCLLSGGLLARTGALVQRVVARSIGFAELAARAVRAGGGSGVHGGDALRGRPTGGKPRGGGGGDRAVQGGAEDRC